MLNNLKIKTFSIDFDGYGSEDLVMLVDDLQMLCKHGRCSGFWQALADEIENKMLCICALEGEGGNK